MGEYSRFNQRIHADGRYKPFCLHREAVKRLLPELLPGCDPIKLAWRVASFRFQPLDGSPHEIPLTDQIKGILAGTPLPMTEQVPKVPAAPESAPTADDDDEFWLDGDPDAGKHTPASLGLPEPEKFPTNERWTKYEQGRHPNIINETLNREEIYRKLKESIDRDKRCKPYDLLQWIFEHMDDELSTIDPDDVPSLGTLYYLKKCQDNPTIAAEFMKSLFPKLIPDKKQLEHDAKQRDDGRPILERLDAFDAEFEGEAATILKMSSDVA